MANMADVGICRRCKREIEIVNGLCLRCKRIGERSYLQFGYSGGRSYFPRQNLTNPYGPFGFAEKSDHDLDSLETEARIDEVVWRRELYSKAVASCHELCDTLTDQERSAVVAELDRESLRKTASRIEVSHTQVKNLAARAKRKLAEWYQREKNSKSGGVMGFMEVLEDIVM